jgi:hypothetical protein
MQPYSKKYKWKHQTFFVISLHRLKSAYRIVLGNIEFSSVSITCMQDVTEMS